MPEPCSQYQAVDACEKPLDKERLLSRIGGQSALLPVILQAFIREARADLEMIGHALESRELKRVVGLAHRLKGAAATVGADHLSNLAREIELEGRGGNLEKAVSGVLALESEIDRCETYLKTKVLGESA